MLLALTSFFVTAVYGLSIGLLLRGLRRVDRPLGEQPAATRSVSIVVAARNERGGVADCVRSILGQTCKDFTLVFVDDRSSDGTLELARSAASADPRVRFLRVEEGDPTGGKKRALIRGINATESELLVFTDADCTPGPRWLESLVEAFEETTVLVAGYSPFRPRNRLFDSVLALENAAHAITAAAMIGLNTPMNCTARSLAYTRTAYRAAGGLESVVDIPSGDDTLMLQRIAELNLGTIRYLLQPEAHVSTPPPSGIRPLLRQKRRHLSTLPRYDTRSKIAAVLVRSMDLLVVVGSPLALLGIIGPAPLWAWLAKVGLDTCGLWVGLGKLRERSLFPAFPVLAAVFPAFILAMSLVAAIRPVSWK
jgi:cellulose synthase/poly-beta-1,6-N-acetylglucosamine synthase-like glycosyltransferase